MNDQNSEIAQAQAQVRVEAQAQELGRTTVRVRPGRSSDATAARALFLGHLRSLGADPDSELDADMEDFPVGYSGVGDLFLCAETESGTVVGMAGILANEIRRVFVVPELRGRGIASALIQTLLVGRGSDRARVFAVVASRNSGARALFERLGFRETTERRTHPKMQDCITFRWERGV